MINESSIDYKQLYDNAPCGYLCFLLNGDIIDVNERFSEFTGFTKEEILHKKKFTDFISKAQQIFYETHFLPILKVQGNIEEVNFSIIRNNGAKFPVLINAVEVKNPTGELLFIQTTIFDISQRKLYEVQLLDARKRADELTLNLKNVNIELNNKNELLRGGLNYSKKIQYSILPSLPAIRESFNDSFIYFQPKDEIGGDFYWHWKNERFAFLAVLDCTGHGVPGALMSMSINSMLNDIVHQEDTFETGDILGLLHEKVYQTLRQERGDEYSQDGCDIGLCRVEFGTNALSYSGANINLLINTGESLNTIKATNKSIGGLAMNGELEPTRQFATITIPYQKNSMIIMTTDGVMDQLDEFDCPFGNQAFKSMLSEVYQAPADMRKKIVASSLSNWMKETPQLDDMLLLGFLPKF